MQIEKINNYRAYIPLFSDNKNNTHRTSYNNNSYALIQSLNNLAMINSLSFTGYALGLSHEELKRRTSENCLSTIKLLAKNSPEYQNLSFGDKEALKHLVLAADYIGEVDLKLNSHDNVPFRNYLDSEIKNGNMDALMTRMLFDAQKSIFAEDMLAQKISLAKGLSAPIGQGLYPKDLTVEEFHAILKKMLQEGKDQEVSQILSLRTVVERDGKYLKAIDYVDKYKEEFSKAADELEKAAKTSSNKEFNKYLILQARALRKANPMLDAKADKQWARLQNTPLEFTITRESYNDKMTTTVFENEELMQMLNERGITPLAKDSLGGRVGIVNREGTDFLLKSKDILPLLARKMPYHEEYEQSIKQDNKQTMVDVDIVAVTGDIGAYRGSITLAENLPNSDKLSLSIGGGRRNVYHRQMHDHKSSVVIPNIMLVPEQRKLMDKRDLFYFSVVHENAHSLGPIEVRNLGKYKNIIEENKADMAAMSFMDDMVEMGFFTKKQRDSILIDFAIGNFLKAKPNITNAHRTRQIMQCKYMLDNGVFEFSPEGKIYVYPDKVVEASRKMLKEIIKIQKDDDYQAAENYVNKYFIWTPEMEYVSSKLKQEQKCLNGRVEEPLADYLRLSE